MSGITRHLQWKEVSVSQCQTPRVERSVCKSVTDILGERRYMTVSTRHLDWKKGSAVISEERCLMRKAASKEMKHENEP